MLLLLVYSLTLTVAIVLSEMAERTVLSTSVLFLVVGAVLAPGSLGVLQLGPDDQIVAILADLALFSVLFTDGMKLDLKDLSHDFHQPGRALLFGLPLTLGATAALAHFIVGLPWLDSLLLGAILSPTDPVLVSAIVGNLKVPAGLRSLLHIESGLNDGLALPVVLVLIGLLREEPLHLWAFAGEVLAGLALGAAVPWLALQLTRVSRLGPSEQYRNLVPFATAMLVFALSPMLHANSYLAAFAAGVTLASITENAEERFTKVAEPITELLKLAALMVFGALLSPTFLAEPGLAGFLFAVLTLFFVRPFALAISLLGRPLPRAQFLAAAWFGPKGFASVVYALLVLRSGITRADAVFHLAALATALSIVAHASTDVPVANWFSRQKKNAQSGVA